MEAGCGSENVYGRPVINQITNFRGDFCIKKFLNEINKPFSLFNFSPLDFYLFYRISLHPPPHFSQRRWGDPAALFKSHMATLTRTTLCLERSRRGGVTHVCFSRSVQITTADFSTSPIKNPRSLRKLYWRHKCTHGYSSYA